MKAQHEKEKKNVISNWWGSKWQFNNPFTSRRNLLLWLATQIPSVKGETADNFYQDTMGTIYKLWLSGVENLSSAIQALNNGECEGLSIYSGIPPQQYELIQNFWDHGTGTSSLYAASLSRDKQGTTNQTIVDCISNKLTQSHNEWEKGRTSPESIAIIVGSFAALLLVTLLMIYFCNRKQQKCCVRNIENTVNVENGAVANPTIK